VNQIGTNFVGQHIGTNIVGQHIGTNIVGQHIGIMVEDAVLPNGGVARKH